MRKLLIAAILFPLLNLLSCINETSFKIEKNDQNSIAIVLPDTANSIVLFAAKELKKHLDLMFEVNIPLTNLSGKNKFRKNFFIGIVPDGYQTKLNPEESVYKIEKNSIYFFGDDAINVRYSSENPGELKDKMLSEVLNLSFTRTGSLFAVYDFLEKELGIKWIKPGDEGVFYTKPPAVSLPEKLSSWTPELKQRNIRTLLTSYEQQLLYGQYAPKEFVNTEDESLKKHLNLLTWMRRMRMGRSECYKFGHSYGKYWEKYKDTNPGIFALTSKGERKPMGRIERIKMCPSNPDLPKIVVAEWKDNLQKNPLQNSVSISGCENDSDGFGSDDWCHCSKCMSLDSLREGEEMKNYVTDRYVYLWNGILKAAKPYKNDILVTGYAYENMLRPPRKVKLEDGILIEFIPRMGGDFEITKKMYEGWENAGMKNMMYRPNDLWWEMGISMGQEERLFGNYKLAIMHKAMGTDFDAIQGYWEGISDITYYILARGHINPQASFEELEEEYLSAFGEAKVDISKFYRHWRNIFNNKILKEELRLNNGINTHFLEWGLLHRLTKRIDEFYSLNDFDLTDSYLKNASEKPVSDQAKNYIKRMQVANEHSRLSFICFLAGKSGDKKLIVEKAKELIDFRMKSINKVDINWNVLFMVQHYQMQDQIGTKYLDFLPKKFNTDSF